MLVIRQTGLSDYMDNGSGRIKVLIMGPPGAGKTRSAGAGWPKPLLADCEEGRMSVADLAIPYAAITSTADMKTLLDFAEAEGKRPKGQRRVETFLLDTLDAYQRIVIQDYLRANKKASMSGWQDWGHLDAEMNELVARLAGLPMNVVVNLHVKDTKVGGSDDGDGGYLVKSPKLKGDLKDQIAAEFDLVGFMETGWEAVDGKRVLSRYVQWEPSPDKPILKDRSGQLPARTPVTFTPEDYLGLLRPLQAAMEKLQAGSVVEQIETPEPTAPESPGTGGPVKSVAKTATKKAAASKTAAPVQSAPSPAPVPVPPTEEQAVATVATVLGGEVAEVTSEPAEGKCEICKTGTPEAGRGICPACDVTLQENHNNEPLPVEPQTPVAASDVASVPASVADSNGSGVSGNGAFTVTCGSPRYTGGTVPLGLNACGQDLRLDMQEDRVTGCTSPEGQIPDLIQIAGLKTRAFLCNQCFAAHRNSSKKKVTS